MFDSSHEECQISSLTLDAKGSLGGGDGRLNPVVNVMLVMSTALDSQLLALQMDLRRGITIIEHTADLAFGMVRCGELSPDVLVIDPKMSGDAVGSALALSRQGFARHVIVLDDRAYEGRLIKFLPFANVSYITRGAGLSFLHIATINIAAHGERVFDPELAQRLQMTRRGSRLTGLPDQQSICSLTTRELEVLEWLARGCSVRDCAEQMHVSHSTIDNHKSRLMKKPTNTVGRLSPISRSPNLRPKMWLSSPERGLDRSLRGA